MLILFIVQCTQGSIQIFKIKINDIGNFLFQLTFGYGHHHIELHVEIDAVLVWDRVCCTSKSEQRIWLI